LSTGGVLPARDQGEEPGRGAEKLQGILLVKGSVGDSDGDVSLLNTARSRGTVTFASPRMPSAAEELKTIRDRLQAFKEQRKKLRSFQFVFVFVVFFLSSGLFLFFFALCWSVFTFLLYWLVKVFLIVRVTVKVHFCR
jgi:hypothetical protein